MERLSRAGRAAAPHALAAAVCLAVAVYATWPLAGNLNTAVLGNLGDPLELAWKFGWVADAIVERPFDLFDANIYHPEHLTLVFSEHHIGAALTVAPLFWLTGNALVAFNAWLLLVLAGAGFAVYLLVADLTGDRWAALVAGAAYVAVPFRVSQAGLGHAHTLAVHLAPLVLLVFWRMTGTVRSGGRCRLHVAALALLVTLSLWTSLTGALMTLIALGVAAAAELFRRRRAAWPVLWRAGAGAALGVVLAVPVLWPYVEVRRDHPGYRHDPVEEIRLSATPGSYLSPARGGALVRGPYRALADRFANGEVAAEKQLFGGLWLTGAAAATLTVASYRRAKRWRRRAEPAPESQPDAAASALPVLVGLAAVSVVLSLGPRWGASGDGIRLPFAWLTEVIPGGLMRAPARIGALTLLALAVVAGIGLARLPGRWRPALIAVSAVCLLLEFAPSSVVLARPLTPTAAHERIARRPGAVLALPTVEYDDAGGLVVATLPRESQHMFLSTAHFRPLTNGWSAYFPPSAGHLTAAVAGLPSPGAFAALRKAGVRTVVVQTGLIPGTRWEDVVPRLRGWPGVEEVDHAEGVVVFDVSHAGREGPSG